MIIVRTSHNIKAYKYVSQFNRERGEQTYWATYYTVSGTGYSNRKQSAESQIYELVSILDKYTMSNYTRFIIIEWLISMSTTYGLKRKLEYYMNGD